MHAQPVVPATVVARSIALLREHFAVLFPVALIFALLQAMMTFATRDSNAAAIASGLSLVLATFFQGMVATFVRDVERGDHAAAEPSPGSLVAAVAPVAGSLLVVSLLAQLGIAVGLILLVVPGLVLMTIWAVVAPVVVIERTGVRAAFGRSRALVSGHGRPVFWTVLRLYLLLLVAIIIGAVVAAGLGEVVGSFVLVLVAALASTVFALGIATLYLRLREAEERSAVPVVADDDPRWTVQP